MGCLEVNKMYNKQEYKTPMPHQDADVRNKNFSERQGSGNFNRGGNNNGDTQNRNGNQNPFGNNERGNRGDGRPQGGPRKNQGGKPSFIPESPIKEQEKHRDDEKRRSNQDRDKRSKKDHIYEDDNEMMMKNKKA